MKRDTSLLRRMPLSISDCGSDSHHSTGSLYFIVAFVCFGVLLGLVSASNAELRTVEGSMRVARPGGQEREVSLYPKGPPGIRQRDSCGFFVSYRVEGVPDEPWLSFSETYVEVLLDVERPRGCNPNNEDVGPRKASFISWAGKTAETIKLEQEKVSRANKEAQEARDKAKKELAAKVEAERQAALRLAAEQAAKAEKAEKEAKEKTAHETEAVKHKAALGSGRRTLIGTVMPSSGNRMLLVKSGNSKAVTVWDAPYIGLKAGDDVKLDIQIAEEGPGIGTYGYFLSYDKDFITSHRTMRKAREAEIEEQEKKKALLKEQHKQDLLDGKAEIQNIADAILKFNATSDFSIACRTPIDGPTEQNEYYIFHSTLTNKHNDYYVCWNASSDCGFAFTNIIKQFKPMRQNYFVKVVGKYTKNLEIQLVGGRTQYIPLLEDCYVDVP